MTTQTIPVTPKAIVKTEHESLAPLTTETVQSAALSLQRVNHVKGCDSLPLGVLGVCDGIPDDALQERLENTTGLLVNHLKRVRTSCYMQTDRGIGRLTS